MRKIETKLFASCLIFCVLLSGIIIAFAEYSPPPPSGGGSEPVSWWIYNDDVDTYLLSKEIGSSGEYEIDNVTYAEPDHDNFYVTGLIGAQNLVNRKGQCDVNETLTLIFDLQTGLHDGWDFPVKNRLKKISFDLTVENPNDDVLSGSEIDELIVNANPQIRGDNETRNWAFWIMSSVGVALLSQYILFVSGCWEVAPHIALEVTGLVVEQIADQWLENQNFLRDEETSYQKIWEYIYDDLFTFASDFRMCFPIEFDLDIEGTWTFSMTYEVEWEYNQCGDDYFGTHDFSETKVFRIEALEDPDEMESDSDSDGVISRIEEDLETYDNNTDSDSDSMPDGWEYIHDLDPTNSSDNSTDIDNDGLSNFAEYNYTYHNSNVSNYFKIGLDPNNNDTDYDGISDFDEINGTFGYVTDPLSVDSDSDNITDYWEINNNLNPNSNDSLSDLDSDGLSNLDEFLQGTDPNCTDSDNDGLSDNEFNLYSTNPDSNDTDGDGISDYDEIITYGTNPLSNDTDSDSLTDYQEIFTYFSNATCNDTDSDVMLDGWEVSNSLNLTNSSDAAVDSESDGIINLYEFGNSTDPWSNDTDNDNLSDFVEIVNYGTDPTINDTDSDGLTDYQEINGIAPHYFTSNPLSNDTDGDNVYDYDEVMGTFGYDSDPNDTNSDSDSLSDYLELIYHNTDPMDDDTDNDGIDDDDEVDGTLGYETDPTDEDTDGDGWKDLTEINCVSSPTSPGSIPYWYRYGTTAYSWNGDSISYIDEGNLYDSLRYEDSDYVRIRDTWTKESYLSLTTSGFADLPEDEFRSPHSYIDRVKISFKTKFYNSLSHYSNTHDFKIKVYLSDQSSYTWTFDSGQIQANHWYDLTWTHTSGGLMDAINDDGEYIQRIEIRVESEENRWGYSDLCIDFIRIEYEVYSDS